MKNKLVDLNNHLFAQLERLSDEELEGEPMEAEVKRAEAIVLVSDQIVKGADLQLKAMKLMADNGYHFKPNMTTLLEDKSTGAAVQ